MYAMIPQKMTGKLFRKVGIKCVNVILLLVMLFTNVTGIAQARTQAVGQAGGQNSGDLRTKSQDADATEDSPTPPIVDTETATPLPTVTEAATPLTPIELGAIDVETSETQTEKFTPTASETPTPEPSSTPFATEILSQTPMVTPTPSSTPTAMGEEPALTFKLFVTPDQAAVGEVVAFTVEIGNSGETAVSGLQFSNSLPSYFDLVTDGHKGFNFDDKTRLLTWDGTNPDVPGEKITLVPSQVMALTYSVQVGEGLDEEQIVDTASLSAEGLEKPRMAEASLTVLQANQKISLLDASGGEAAGVDGHVKVKLPEGALQAGEAVIIEDLKPKQELQATAEEEVWLMFSLELRRPQPEKAELLSASAASPYPLLPLDAGQAQGEGMASPTSTQEVLTEELAGITTVAVDESPTATPEPITTAVPEETATLEPTATGLPEETATPVPDAEQPVEEQDRLIPLEAVEAQFDQPVEITISFEGLAELRTLGAEMKPYLVTLDESSDTWVQVPVENMDREANTITAKVRHFSTWGTGIGGTFPNGAGLLLFDEAYPSLFSGQARYSIPIWTPPGRNGLGPKLALSYSSGVIDGILGNIQAPWTGMGWNVDSAEISRQILNGACGPYCHNGYGYADHFMLSFNGIGEVLIPDGTTGRYHTKSESFLYIQLHNYAIGNQNDSEGNSPPNTSGEWWEVVEKDGTRWRLGWNGDSEQLAAMKGYPGTNSGSWAESGYGGHALNVVAGRWRADQVTDTHGNLMKLTYAEETRQVGSTGAYYDRANYLDTISYTGTTDQPDSGGYSVVFVREVRPEEGEPEHKDAYDNWDDMRLDKIEVRYGTEVKRIYDLGFEVRDYVESLGNGMVYRWDTTVLTSVAISGGGVSLPTMTFGYVDKTNRKYCGGSCRRFPYPRLVTIANGWGGSATFTIENDSHSGWLNWRVQALEVDGGGNSTPMITIFDYGTSCYRKDQPPSHDPTADWTCTASEDGALVGYQSMFEVQKDSNGQTLATSYHSFYTDERTAGREYQTEQKDASGTTLSQTNTSYTVATGGLPTGGYFTYASAVEQFQDGGRVSRTEYEYDTSTSTSTGNLLMQKDFDGQASLYRQTEYSYQTNTTKWMLDKVWKRVIKDSASNTIAEQRYGYDGNLPGSGSLSLGDLTLSRQVNGSQTVDTKFIYNNPYGNIDETRVYQSYGTVGSQPDGTFVAYSRTYDGTLHTFPISETNPLGTTTTAYDYGLGLPTSVTDPNNNITLTAYDGLGRVTDITYPGYGQANVEYIYPSLPVSAPFAIKMKMWDEPAGVYRNAWQMQDALGRVIQTQGPYETSGNLIVSDTSYNAQGLVENQGLPRTLSGDGGNYYAPNWASLPHTASSYDALGRTISVAYPDSSQESSSYSGLSTTTIDRNGHQKVQQVDAFGRLIKVEEYTGSGTYTLYATTTYAYDPRDLLTDVSDAQSNQTQISYDGFGRKTGMDDPDMGEWSYEYDTLGNLVQQNDARGCITDITYDELNRPTSKTYSGTYCTSTATVSYTYDSTDGGNKGIGHRTGMADGSGLTTWVYNMLGQVATETHNIDGNNYQLGFTFDAFGRVITQSLPSGEGLTYNYNAMGALSSLSGTSTYVSQMHYNASGQVTDQVLGNGLTQQLCYEVATLRLAAARTYPGTLQSCAVANPDNARLNLSYEYEPNGNISQMVDSTRSETLNYTYDELDRLLSVGGAYNQGYTYNTIGNITAKGSESYTYNTTHKHAVASLSTGENYTYDVNGNMTQRVEGGQTYTQTFDAENRLISVTVNSQTTQFAYDGDGNLVKKIKPDGSCTIYVGGMYEEEMSTCGGAVTHTTTYYPAGGAMRVDGTLYFVLKDQLGSSLAITGADGTLISEQRYMPFGQERAGIGPITQTDLGYTGQRDVGMGLMDYKARFYDPYLGRFIQADTVVRQQDNPQALNRYAYVLNNPIVYNDPTGQKECVDNDEHGNCLSSTQVLIRDIESEYKVKMGGPWDEDESLVLAKSLSEASNYLGGIDNLNGAILASLETAHLNKDYLTINNMPGATKCPKSSSYACYDPKTGTIYLADYVFTSNYQRRKNRPFELGLTLTDLGIQTSIVHEIAHMLKVANPEALVKYKHDVSNPQAIDPDYGPEENMADAIAFYVMSNGGISDRYREQLIYAASVPYLWHYSP